jgi:hypothetical protein
MNVKEKKFYVIDTWPSMERYEPSSEPKKMFSSKLELELALGMLQ